MEEVNENDIWLGALQRLRSLISPKELETWFAPLSLEMNGNLAVVVVPNHFFADWIRDRYRPVLDQALAGAVGRPMEVVFRVSEEGEVALVSRQEESRAQPFNTNLNPRYSFSTLVVGPCNELAYAACQAVAAAPGKQYNPLFIFGGAGLGKTHLINAVGNEIQTRNPGKRVYYTSAESFTNELIQAVRFDGIQRFQEKYRQVDCLLLDDIQFLAGRERTQEELFHTFNALHDAGKQIVLTSDKMPREIRGLEKRLRTRFEWGLIADIQPPDEETSVAILQKKAAERGLELSRSVAFFLARQPQTNVRVMEGLLTKIIAISRFQGAEVTLELVRRVVEPMMGTRQFSLDEILQVTADYFGVKVSDLKSSAKTRKISHPRQVAMYLARRLTRTSFPEIGRAFGGKDHSTVVKGFKKVEESIRKDPEVGDQVREVERLLLEGQGPER